MRTTAAMCWLGLLILPTVCVAFLEPADRAAGIEVRIEGVPEQLDPAEGLVFTVVVDVGQAAVRVRGRVTVGLNDDWVVQGENEVEVDVSGPGAARLQFRADANPRVLFAHYPVHARAVLTTPTLEGVYLHPVAIFRTVPSADEAPGPAAGADMDTDEPYRCYRGSRPIVVDGDLQDWHGAAVLPCTAAQQTTGTISPDSFDGSFMALHDGTSLYLAVRAADDDVSCTDVTSRDFVNSDYVRVYLSGLDPLERTDDTLGLADQVVAINVCGGEAGPRAKVVTYDDGARQDVPLDEWRLASRQTATGYVLEMAVPLASLEPAVGEGDVLGVNVLIGDADGGRRVGELALGRRVPDYWLTPRAYLRMVLESSAGSGSAVPEAPLVSLTTGSWRLEQIHARRCGLSGADQPTRFPAGWEGSDTDTGAVFIPASTTRGGMTLEGFRCHPPWRRESGGTVWCEYRLELPADQPAVFTFQTAIRDHRDDEPPSDGVEFAVTATPAEGEEQELFRRFTASKAWEPARIDLSSFAGAALQLRLAVGPGPEGNTVCDSGYWGEPTIVVGNMPEPEPAEQRAQRMARAAEAARQAARGGPSPMAVTLSGRNGTFGAAVAPGPRGLVDAAIAISDGHEALLFEGFGMGVDGENVGDWRAGISVDNVDVDGDLAGDEGLRIHHRLRGAAEPVVATATLRRVQGALQVSFSMPGVRRDARGNPRFTRLALEGGPQTLHRAYLGFGNVVENPGPFRVRRGGFGLSTRHIGADYTNGLSLVQASDLFPDWAVYVPAENRLSLEVHHDAALLLVPSASGAFHAARHYRDLCGFRPGAGVDRLLGRMCIDQWGGDYGEAADGLSALAKYGVTHAVFVKHVWQRWGYDYRLPEIYPPRGDVEDFMRMVHTCERHGILFAPHDNYIDFYPDARGFSYDHIIFNRDGTPQRAWFNKGRQAQSYRWLPHGFGSWLDENLRLMREGFQPTGLFIDVFSAMAPMDYYDRAGRFYPLTETTRQWCRAFDRSRDVLGEGAPMLSEAGHDALVGSLDGAEADHYSADRWGIDSEASCRTPWHDMATHGSFVLLAGGLGHRYSNEDSAHGYGSDDYLSNTVIGGRNPMCDGPFSRRTVMTYWLLHEVCNQLARESFEAHEFVDGRVWRQHTTFGRGSEVWTNRGEETWEVAGRQLPRYGFWVRTPTTEAGVFEADGQRVGYAQSRTTLFVDTRPRSLPVGRRRVATEVESGRYLGDGLFELVIRWTVREALADGARPFVHLCHDEAGDNEKIAFQATCPVPEEALQTAGSFMSTVRVQVPEGLPGGVYRVRYGLYNPKRGGARIIPLADLDGSRVRGGLLVVNMRDGQVADGRYEEETSPAEAGVNVSGRMIQVGPVTTNGAFRLEYGNPESWVLTPLPGSLPFEVRIDAAELGLDDEAVLGSVACVEPFGPETAEPQARMGGRTVTLSCDAQSFAYIIRFGQ